VFPKSPRSRPLHHQCKTTFADLPRLEPPFVNVLLVIPHGFEANFTIGFVRGLTHNGVTLRVASCAETHARLVQLGIPCENLFGQRSSSGGRLHKLAQLFRYYGRLLNLLLRHRDATVHFIGVFRGYRAFIEGPLFAFAFRLLCRRYVYTVHNVLPHGRDHSRAFACLYRFLYRFPHRLLVHTTVAREQLIREFHVPPEKLVSTSIGLNEDVPDTALSTEAARARLGFEPGHRVILFFGKIEPYKGLDVLLAAFDQLGDPVARLIIAGDAPNSAYREQILAQVERSSRRSQIRLEIRHVPNEEVETFFKGADVLCLPYRNIYQSGLVFLAPRFGLPMVSTDVGNLRSFIGDAGRGIVADFNDAPGLAKALSLFFAQRERFPREAIIAGVQPYRWETVCRDLVPLYQPAPAAPHSS